MAAELDSRRGGRRQQLVRRGLGGDEVGRKRRASSRATLSAAPGVSFRRATSSGARGNGIGKSTVWTWYTRASFRLAVAEAQK